MQEVMGLIWEIESLKVCLHDVVFSLPFRIISCRFSGRQIFLACYPPRCPCGKLQCCGNRILQWTMFRKKYLGLPLHKATSSETLEGSGDSKSQKPLFFSHFLSFLCSAYKLTVMLLLIAAFSQVKSTCDVRCRFVSEGEDGHHQPEQWVTSATVQQWCRDGRIWN